MNLIHLSNKKFVVATLLYFSVIAVATAADNTSEMAWGPMLMGLFGGLALFLFGMEQMADGLKAVAGDRMKQILAKLTGNRFVGAATGALVTAVIQSSSVTTVLVVGFISAGLMSAAQSVGVIMGANIGTTITAQIVAFKVTKLALLLIAVGFTMLFFSKKERIKQYGGIIMGLGLVFFGMSVMSDAMKPLRSYQPFLDLMIHMESPLVGITIAALFTALIQSSSATTGIVIVMASQGFISLPAGIALAMGANIGTCMTAILASIGKPREAVRAAAVHVFFNVAGVLLWVLFIPQLADFIVTMSPSHPELTGLARLGAETPRQIANAHTLFNLANTLIFIGFTTQIAHLVERLIPDTEIEQAGLHVTAKYLDDELLSTPSLALDLVRLEALHMGEVVQEMLKQVMPAILSRNKKALQEISLMDDEVDILYEQTIEYIGKISSKSLTSEQTSELMKLISAVSDLETIGDTIETNLVTLGRRLIDSEISVSSATSDKIVSLHHIVRRTLSSAVQAVGQHNLTAADAAFQQSEKLDVLFHETSRHQLQRLTVDEPHRVTTYALEVDIIDKLKQIFYLAQQMARSVVMEKENEQPEVNN